MTRVLLAVAVAGTAAFLLVPAAQARHETPAPAKGAQVSYDPWLINLIARQNAGVDSTANSLPDSGTNWGVFGGALGGAAFAVLVSAGLAVTVRRSRHLAHA